MLKPLILVLASLGQLLLPALAQAQESILWTGTIKAEPGYSSTYLPLNKGYIVGQKYGNKLEEHLPQKSVGGPKIIKVDVSERSLAERFDQARRKVLNTREDEDLKDFMAYYDYDPNEDEWRGMCHQFTSANCDPKVKAITKLPCEKGSDNILCGNVLLEATDLRELFTSTYPSKNEYFLGGARNAPNEHYSKAFFEKENLDFIKGHGGMEAFKAVNMGDFAIMDSLGLVKLPAGKVLPEKWLLMAHPFHQSMVKGLEGGRGVALNIDPNEEIWNQAVFSMESTATATPTMGAELPYFRYGSDDAEVGNHFFYFSREPQGEQILTKLDHIDRALGIIVSKRDKTPLDKISDILRQGSAPAVDEDVMAFVEKAEAEGRDLVSVVAAVLDWKQRLFREGAEKGGIKLKDHFIMEKVDTHIQFMDEHDEFRESGNEIGTNHYQYLAVKNRSNGYIYSQWLGAHEKNSRPGFLWYPALQSDLCQMRSKDPQYRQRFREILKNKEYVLREGPEVCDKDKEKRRWNEAVDVCLNVGLGDLLHLCEGCSSLKEAYKQVADMLSEIVRSEGGKVRFQEKFIEGMDKIKRRHVDVDEELLTELIDAEELD